MGLLEAFKTVNEKTVPNAVIDAAIPDAETASGTKVPATWSVTKGKGGALGDGTILNAIIAFFQSPQGQALINTLIQLLIHALGGSRHNRAHDP